MADRRAMASGLSVSDMATEAGCDLKTALCGGAGRGWTLALSTGGSGSGSGSWGAELVGVIGDTGGRLGESGREEVESVEEAGRGLVSTIIAVNLVVGGCARAGSITPPVALGGSCIDAVSRLGERGYGYTTQRAAQLSTGTAFCVDSQGSAKSPRPWLGSYHTRRRPLHHQPGFKRRPANLLPDY